MSESPATPAPICTAPETSPTEGVVASATTYAARKRRPNPPPGEPGHSHWGGPRPWWISRAEWRAYGDRGPGSRCRWLSEHDPDYCPGEMSCEECEAKRRARGGAA